MPQSQTADQPMASWGMDTDTHDLFKVKQPAIFLSKMIDERDRASKTKLENNGLKQTTGSNNKISSIHKAFQ